jgi:hypothetical protein
MTTAYIRATKQLMILGLVAMAACKEMPPFDDSAASTRHRAVAMTCSYFLRDHDFDSPLGVGAISGIVIPMVCAENDQRVRMWIELALQMRWARSPEETRMVVALASSYMQRDKEWPKSHNIQIIQDEVPFRFGPPGNPKVDYSQNPLFTSEKYLLDYVRDGSPAVAMSRAAQD